MNLPSEAELIDMERRGRWLADESPQTNLYRDSPSMAAYLAIEVTRETRATAGRDLLRLVNLVRSLRPSK